jgi:hypothetical protein
VLALLSATWELFAESQEDSLVLRADLLLAREAVTCRGSRAWRTTRRAPTGNLKLDKRVYSAAVQDKTTTALFVRQWQ